VAVTTPSRAHRGPRAAGRRAFRNPAQLPAEPVGVEILAAIKQARDELDRIHAWDARLETSCIAALAYLWRRGRGERWAGRHGSATFACSIAQLTLGLAPIMGWRNIPDRRDHVAVDRFVRAHRRSVQRWLDWLQAAALVTHTPQQDAEGFWWRTIITLHACPELPSELLRDAVDRRAGWRSREARRQARGRRRNLTAILRRARLSRAEKRSRAIARRRQLACHAERVRVRRIVLEALTTHLAHPFGASTTSQATTTATYSENELDRGHARTTNANSNLQPIHQTTAKAAIEEHRPGRERDPATRQAPHSELNLSKTFASSEHRNCADRGGGDPPRVPAHPTSQASNDPAQLGAEAEEIRDAVYGEVAARRWYRDSRPAGQDEQLAAMARADQEWEPLVARQRRRLAELADWPLEAPAPPRWRLLEAWAVAAHGPQMACAGAFRLAFFSERRANHGPRLDRALARYQRHADSARPAGWPRSPIAALARWIGETVRRQDGPEHGIAIDIARFDRFTKQMAAYAHYQRPEHLARAARRAQRRRQLQDLADQVNLRLSFRTAEASPAARLKTAAQLLDSTHPNHKRMGATLYAKAQHELRLEQRDRQLLTGRHPGLTDGRYIAACDHADRWGLPTPHPSPPASPAQ
jgi:hypothetical protein